MGGTQAELSPCAHGLWLSIVGNEQQPSSLTQHQAVYVFN